MSDEQKRQVVMRMKQAMQYGEVEYEAGLEIRKITGWYGIMDLAPGGAPNNHPSLFGPQNQSRSIAVGVIVLQDIDTPIHDQEHITVPFARVLSMRTAPQVP